MAFPEESTIIAFLEPKLAKLNLAVDDVATYNGAGESTVAVVVDSEAGVDLDQLELASDSISQWFDTAEEEGELDFGPSYRLDVTTRGIEAPLQLPRHFRRAQGRLVRIAMKDPKSGDELALHGRLGALADEEDKVALVVDKKTAISHINGQATAGTKNVPKKGQGAAISPKRIGRVSLPLATLDEVREQIEFSEPKGLEYELATEAFDSEEGQWFTLADLL